MSGAAADRAAAGCADVGGTLDDATAQLHAAGVPGARRDARLLLAHVLGVGVEAILARPEWPVTPSQSAAFDALRARRAAREPLSRILGEREFWGLSLRLSAATLDPRPDSETLVEAVLDGLPSRGDAGAVLDLGTGSGCLLLALLSALPKASGLGQSGFCRVNLYKSGRVPDSGPRVSEALIKAFVRAFTKGPPNLDLLAFGKCTVGSSVYKVRSWGARQRKVWS